jgi:subfamily B ATP-binding cassette protein MsbA
LVSLSILPFFVLSLKLLNKKIRKLGEQNQERQAQNRSLLQEVISGMRLIKSFVRENMQLSKYRKSYQRMVDKRLELRRMTILSMFLTDFIASFGPVIVLIYGGSEVLRGNLTIGQLMAFSSFLAYIYGPVQALMNININIQSSIGAIKRIFEIFDLPAEVSDTI